MGFLDKINYSFWKGILHVKKPAPVNSKGSHLEKEENPAATS